MPNPAGYPQTLVHERGNTNAAKHAAYSPRLREPRARELAAYVAELSPVATPADAIACDALGSLLAHGEAIDAALAESGPVNARQGTVRALLDIRLRLDRRIAEWSGRLALDPASRAKIARDMGAGSLAAELRGLLRDDE